MMSDDKTQRSRMIGGLVVLGLLVGVAVLLVGPLVIRYWQWALG